MTRIMICVLAALLLMPGSSPAQTIDTPAAAKALVPLLQGVKARMRPHLTVEPGAPQPSPFTGTQTSLLAFKVGKKETPIEPKVAKAIDQLSAWKINGAADSPEAILFGHWLEQLTLKSAAVGLLNCDATCVVDRFTKPDEAFGRTRTEREATRDQLLLDALSTAVVEIQPQRD